MINFKSNYKSDYNKIIENKKDSDENTFKSRTAGSVRISYAINSDRTRTVNDRFIKVVSPK